jgi:hypothetical protein
MSMQLKWQSTNVYFWLIMIESTQRCLEQSCQKVNMAIVFCDNLVAGGDLVGYMKVYKSGTDQNSGETQLTSQNDF